MADKRCARTPKAELGRWAFEPLRYLPGGGENFGCGSSREMAVWALAGMGIRWVIASSFGEIFHGNCSQNGVLAIQLPAAEVGRLMARAVQHRPRAPDAQRRAALRGLAAPPQDAARGARRARADARDARAHRRVPGRRPPAPAAK